ncbi:universal stress protein [Litoribacter ruber]|uniref:Universal stress protein n=1 Tax=Litoribacter ruber TaxID=702568 RepID=A0AAP2G5X4_9BACT|nr:MULTISPECIES: universal stress protein [Litoribacter]MBS9525995.1 universal stress protein [Litoribacter alkaliphilus]MBT0813151.1 universal stress protein [Litoribacter ruber]
MKRILVPIDFSSYSENALLSAVKIAAKGDAHITCLNVVNSPLDWASFSDEKRAQHHELLELEAESKEKLDTFVLEHAISTNPVETLVDIGLPSNKILENAKRLNVDLIVMGAYGKGHQPDKFLGSNLQKVIRQSVCPVLAVKSVVDSSSIRKIAFASIFSPDSKPAYLKLKPLVKFLEASLNFVYVNTPSKNSDSDKAMEAMNSFLVGEHDQIVHKHIFNAPEVEKGILQFSEMNQVGIIAIASSDRKAARSYQIGVTDTVLYKSDIPVLSVNLG